MEISKEKVDEIVKKYPQQLQCHPRAAFEHQLRIHLYKSLGIKYKEPKPEENKNVGKKR